MGLYELTHRIGEGDMAEGAEESVFSAGLTDLEINQNPTQTSRQFGAGTVTSLGFWTDDVESAHGTMRDRGAKVGAPPSEITTLPGHSRMAFTFEGIDGLRMEIAQRD